MSTTGPSNSSNEGGNGVNSHQMVECQICMGLLDAETSTGEPIPVVATICGHLYHEQCLKEWFDAKKKNICPSCDKVADPALQRKIYISSVVYKPSAGWKRGTETGERGTTDYVRSNATNRVGSASEQPPIAFPLCECGTEDCRCLITAHLTLVDDYGNLLQNAQNLRDSDNMNAAMNASLTGEVTRLQRENDEVKERITIYQRWLHSTGQFRTSTATPSRLTPPNAAHTSGTPPAAAAQPTGTAPPGAPPSRAAPTGTTPNPAQTSATRPAAAAQPNETRPNTGRPTRKASRRHHPY